MTDARQPWALILGASSGFGEATAKALAAAGYDIAGVHLDRRQGMAHVDEIKADIAGHGREALFVNMNAADDGNRAEFLAALRDAVRRPGEGDRPRALRPRPDALPGLRHAQALPGAGRRQLDQPQEPGDDARRHGQQPCLLGAGHLAGQASWARARRSMP